MPPLRIVVDWDLCQSNAVCQRLAPKVFHVNPETDQLDLLQETPDDAVRAQVEEAVRMCPRGALSLDEGD